MKTKRFLFTAGIVLATAFTFSCSSDKDDDPSSSPNGGGGSENPALTKTTFIDDRDNKSYKKVKIGTQTWMAENLNYNPSTGNSACYDDDPANCAKVGRLYDWSTAMNLPLSCNESICSSQIQTKHKGICPSGWHIPSNAEWRILIDYVGGGNTAGTKLKAVNGWYFNGTDEYGFSALPGGVGFAISSFYTFSYVDVYGNWWSSSECESWGSCADHLSMGYDESTGLGSGDKLGMYNVRCLQD